MCRWCVWMHACSIEIEAGLAGNTLIRDAAHGGAELTSLSLFCSQTKAHWRIAGQVLVTAGTMCRLPLHALLPMRLRASIWARYMLAGQRATGRPMPCTYHRRRAHESPWNRPTKLTIAP